MLLFFRSVQLTDKALALGLQFVMLRLFGKYTNGVCRIGSYNCLSQNDKMYHVPKFLIFGKCGIWQRFQKFIFQLVFEFRYYLVY